MREPTKPAKPAAQPAATPVSAAAMDATGTTSFTQPPPLASSLASATMPPPGATSDAGTATATSSTAAPDAEKLKAAATIGTIERGGAIISGLGIGGLRLLLPAMSAYAGTRDPNATPDDSTDSSKDTTKLSRRETAILTAAAGKALLELVEIASRTDPLMPGAEPYVAYSDGVYRPPHLMHLLSVATAANRVLGDKTDTPDTEPPPPAERIPNTAYIALAPGEYASVSGPLSPTAIRRSAMRERSYNAPELAMLAKSSNQFQTAPAPAGGGTSMAMMRATSGPNYNAQAYGMQAKGSGNTITAYQGGGCGCGGSGGGCGCGNTPAPSCGCTSCGGTSHQFSPARRNDDNSCAGLLTISCDTRWRLRECLKFTLCDFLRCVGDEVCDDGQFAPNPNLRACLEGLVCSLLTCIPEAICPTPPAVQCLPRPRDDCNYATGR